MHSLDRKALVQESYRKSFEVKADLQAKIGQKEGEVAALEARNRELKERFSQCNFGEIEEMERAIGEIKLEFRTGRKLLKESEVTERQKYSRTVMHRSEEVDRASNLLVRLREWIKKQERNFELAISKKNPIEDHFNLFIRTLLKDLKEA